ARELPPGSGVGLRLTLRLARRPLWLLGFLCDFGGFALEALAFSAAPATLVAPLFACDVVFFVILARLVLGEPLTRGLLAGIATAGAGIVVLAVTFGGDSGLGRPATATELLALTAGALVVAALAVLVVRRGWARRGPA